MRFILYKVKIKNVQNIYGDKKLMFVFILCVISIELRRKLSCTYIVHGNY